MSGKKTFRAVARQVRERIEAFRKEREEGILKSASNKKFYPYTRDCINSLSQLGPLHDSHGNLTANDFLKAELFNTFFHSVFTINDNILLAFADVLTLK